MLLRPRRSCALPDGGAALADTVAKLRRLAGRAVLALPDAVIERAFSPIIGYGADDVPLPIDPPTGDVRLLVAPANYAGQGFEWARAARSLPGVGAMNLQIVAEAAAGFRTDATVSAAIAARSRRWGEGQWEAVRGFTHVLIEAERSILGRRFGGALRREVRAMLDAGLRVALVAHGSDLRLPSRHSADSSWSPFREADWGLRSALEALATENQQIIEEFDVPVFVATPDLLVDAPGATWLPNVVTPADWATIAPILNSPRLRVVHAPTNTVIKGTTLVEPTMLRMVSEDVIEYRRIEGVEPLQMRALYERADVVLDQFRLGIYSTTAIEAMAAGRIVIARLSNEVRDRASVAGGMEIPIVQADPDSLRDVLLDIVARPDHYSEIAARGPEFVRAAHSAPAAANALRGFLLGSSSAARY